MNKNYQAIGFDWNGVVFSPGLQERFATAAARLLDTSVDQFQQVYYRHNKLLNVGNADPRQIWAIILEELDRGASLKIFLDFLENIPPGTINQEMIRLIKILRSQGLKTGLLSNNSIAGAREARSLGISELFDIVLFSAEIGVMKPDIRAFQTLADRLGVTRGQLIFVDDSEKSLENAESIGYAPILYHSVGDLAVKLRQLCVLHAEF